MNISICICTSCHLKGSKSIIDIFQEQIKKNNLEDKVELKASFCNGNCKDGTFVTIDGKEFEVTPENAETFFSENVVAKLA